MMMMSLMVMTPVFQEVSGQGIAESPEFRVKVQGLLLTAPGRSNSASGLRIQKLRLGVNPLACRTGRNVTSELRELHRVSWNEAQERPEPITVCRVSVW